MTAVTDLNKIIMQQATGFCVSWTCGDGTYDLYYTAEWDDAVAAYSEPPMGYCSAGISACKDGVPFARLDAPTIVQIVRPRLGRTLRDVAAE
jgi:hypothetical protein